MTDSISLSPLQQRLDTPAREISLAELAASWFQQTVEVQIPGYGAMAGHRKLLPFIRRAWGTELMKGASNEALNEQPCPWLPPCALDVFFREQLRRGKHGIPKPYVLAADRQGQDLAVKLGVFGLACDWLPAVVERLVEALRTGVSWNILGRGLFLPAFEIGQVRTGTIEGLEGGDVPQAVELAFITPVDASGKHDILDEPHSLVGRLARRIDGLARWQDARIDADWSALSHHWRGLDYWTQELAPDSTARWSQRQRSNLVNAALSGRMTISGDLAPVWPLIQIGQLCHVGRGAVTGQGRYVAEWLE